MGATRFRLFLSVVLTKFCLTMSFHEYPFLILLAPLAAAPIVGLLGQSLGPKISRVGVAAEVIAFALSLVVLYEVSSSGPQTNHFALGRDGIWQLTLYIDRLSAVMLAHIAAISTLIHLFSRRYMQQERGYARFHSLLAFTTFVLFGMVSSANLLTLFAFWQLLSWLLPLMSYNYEHPPTVRGAFRTFVMQRIGDVAFLAGILLAYSFYGTLDLQQLFARAAEARTAVSLWPGGFDDKSQHRCGHFDLRRRDEQVGAVSLAHVATRFPLRAHAGHRPPACRNHQCWWISLDPTGAALRFESGHASFGFRHRVCSRLSSVHP